MHIADIEGGNLGANGIVGGGLPIAVGVGHEHQGAEAGARVHGVLRRRRDQRRRVPRVAQHGVDLEAAGRLRLREQQVRDVDGHRARRWRCANVADRASAYAMPGVTVDGNDLPAVAAAAAPAIDRARSGGGPSLVECKTYRIRGHRRATAISIAPRKRSRRGASAIRSAGSRPTGGAAAASRAASSPRSSATRSSEIDAALEFAKASPDPDPAQLTRDVYAD